MERYCYFCRKPLGVEKRAEMFCGLRCQRLYAQLGRNRPESQDNPPRPAWGAPARSVCKGGGCRA